MTPRSPHPAPAHITDLEMMFTGTWAHTLIHDLVADGTISTGAAWLLMVVDSMSQDEDRTPTSYSSNRLLASRIHKSPSTVARYLTELQMAALLCIEWRGAKRRLRITRASAHQLWRSRQ